MQGAAPRGHHVRTAAAAPALAVPIRGLHRSLQTLSATPALPSFLPVGAQPVPSRRSTVGTQPALPSPPRAALAGQWHRTCTTCQVPALPSTLNPISYGARAKIRQRVLRSLWRQQVPLTWEFLLTTAEGVPALQDTRGHLQALLLWRQQERPRSLLRATSTRYQG